jgi:hypothetical protein
MKISVSRYLTEKGIHRIFTNKEDENKPILQKASLKNQQVVMVLLRQT